MNQFPYDAVVFDLDGTLFDAEEGIVSSVESAMEELGLPIPEGADLRQVVGPPLLDSFRNLLHVPEDKLDAAVESYKRHFAEEGMFRYQVYPHIRSILQMLREGGVHVGLATSKDRFIARRVMDTFGLSHYFDAIIGENDAHAKLGKPELIRRALPEKYRCAAMVGDRCFDVNGAKGAGIESVGVSYGCGSEEGTDSGDDLVGDPQRIESVHLLPVCTVDGRVACVDTDAFLAFLLRLLHDVYDLIQVHHGTVVDDRTFLVSGQYVGVDQ